MILSKLSIKFTFILLFMVATTALSQKFFDLYPRIPERLELFPGLDIVFQRWTFGVKGGGDETLTGL